MSRRTVFYYNKGDKVQLKRKEMIESIFRIPPSIREKLLSDGSKDIVIAKKSTDEYPRKELIHWLNENPFCWYNKNEFKYMGLYHSIHESIKTNQITIERNCPEIFQEMSQVYKTIMKERPQLEDYYFKFRYGSQFFTYLLERDFPRAITWDLTDFVNELGVNPETYNSMSMIEIRVVSSIIKGFKGIEGNIVIRSQRGPTTTNSKHIWLQIDYGSFDTKKIEG